VSGCPIEAAPSAAELARQTRLLQNRRRANNEIPRERCGGRHTPHLFGRRPCVWIQQLASSRLSKSQLVSPGSIQSKLQNYFDKGCFPNKGLPPIIGDDGKGRAFGNTGTGIVVGPPRPIGTLLSLSGLRCLGRPKTRGWNSARTFLMPSITRNLRTPIGQRTPQASGSLITHR
jgi:hypothetical protein